jgi:hypothetical protein
VEERIMDIDERLTREEFHRRCAKDLFNHVWTLLEMKQRPAALDDEMIHAAHASRCHWGVVGAPVNLVRGEWQIARVYAVLGRAEPALYHARQCLAICEAQSIDGFDLGAAHEAMARAFAIAGAAEDARRHVEIARRISEQIRDEADRRILIEDLQTLPI